MSLASAATAYVPQAPKVVAKPLLPKAPKPEPVSNAHVKPAATSGIDGSVAAPVRMTSWPTTPFVGLGVSETTVGGTFEIETVAEAIAVSPLPSVTLTLTVGVAGPS